MSTNVLPVELEPVACDICLREVPVSEAVVPEAGDYVAHFCGLQCYQQWLAQRERAGRQDEPVKG